MASLLPYSAVLGHRHAKHLLRRATYLQNKIIIDDFASKTVDQAVEDLFVIPSLNLPEPIDIQTLDYFVNLGGEATSTNDRLKSYIIAWWMEEARFDSSIAHKLEFFLHSIFVTNFSFGYFRETYDYLNLLRLTSSRFANGNFEMDSYKNLALKMVTDNLMLQYLNGRENTKENPNENFAREFLELFTIGKGEVIATGNYTTYTENDIVEAAKIFTGFDNKDRPWGPGGDPFYTDPQTGIQRGLVRHSQHDTSNKTFSAAFNNTVITGAVDNEDMWRELSDFVDMVFAQPATAVNICKKIYRYFVGSKITAEIENDIIIPLSQTLINNDFKISIVVKQLLKSKHFYDMDDSDASDEIIGNTIKSPFEMLMQTMNLFNVQTPHYYNDAENHYYRWYSLTVQRLMMTKGGMNFFYPDSVAGYPAYYQEPSFSRNWFSSSTLIARYKQAEIILSGNRVLAGGNNGGVSLDIVDFVSNSNVVTDPYNAEGLVDDLTHYLFAEDPLPDRASYFLNIFLDGLTTSNWYSEWENYVQTGNDEMVKIPLQTLFKSLISSQEYGLM